MGCQLSFSSFLKLDSFSFSKILVALARIRHRMKRGKDIRTKEGLAACRLGLEPTEIDTEFWPPKWWSQWKPCLYGNRTTH